MAELNMEKLEVLAGSIVGNANAANDYVICDANSASSRRFPKGLTRQDSETHERR